MVAGTIAERVARLEAMMEDLTRQISRELDIARRIHEATNASLATLTALVQSQDGRLNAMDRLAAKGLGALSVIILLVSLFSPVIRRFLGLPD